MKETIEDFFDFNLKMNSWIGFNCTFRKEGRTFSFVNRLPTILVNVLGVITVVMQVNFIIDIVQTNSLIAMQIMCQLVTILLSIFKGFMIASSMNGVQIIFSKLGILWEQYRREDSDRTVLTNTYFYCQVYFGLMAALLTCYDLPPIVNIFLQYVHRVERNYSYDFSERVLLIKYPFEITKLSTFIFFFLEEEFFLITCCIFWAVPETLFAQVVTQVRFQLKILKGDFEEAYKNIETNGVLSLNHLIQRHLELLRLCSMIEDIFSPILFCCMFLTSMDICVNVIGVTETIAKGLYQQTGVYFCLSIGIAIQLLLYCVLAESLSEETTTLADTVYNLNWTETDKKARLYIHLMIVRAQRPFYFTACGFFPIGHKSITSILNTAFSYYMVLRTTN